MPPTVETQRRRAEHLGPKRRRPQVLDAALKIGARDGLSAVTVGSVADSLCVTRPVVYSCFPDRLALITALLDREAGAMRSDLLEALHHAHGEDPEQAFVIGMRGVLASVNSRTDAWLLLMADDTDPQVVSRVDQLRDNLKQQAASWIRPALVRWWDMQDLDRKLPLLMELFAAGTEAAIRCMLAERPADADAQWQGDSDGIGQFYGSALYRAFHGA